MSGWKILYLLLFFHSCLLAQSDTSETAIKKVADKYFDKYDFNHAQQYYKGLLDKHSTSTEYNFKYGVCLMFTDTNKAACIKYLFFAVNQPNPPILSYIYLAKAFHYNYKFDDAINYFEKFKQLAYKDELRKYNVDLQIQYCKNAKLLTEKPVETEIISRTPVSRPFFISAYDKFLPEEKLYGLSEEFKTKFDKKTKENFLMCLYNNTNAAILSSYGSSGKNGKDLFRKIKFGNEKWSKSRSLGKEINGKFDEDYPYILSDGSVLYFCSNGDGSMGGYDIFRSDWDEQQQEWSKPSNMGYPINSPFDDLLFTPLPGQQIAYITSDRYSAIGRVDVLKIKYPKENITTALIKGMFEVEGDPGMKKAQLTVIDIVKNELVGIYNTNKKGNYVIFLAPDGKYQFLLKAKGYQEHSVIIHVPEQDRKYILKQYIRLKNNEEYETALFYDFFSEEESNEFSSSSSVNAVLSTAKNIVKSELSKVHDSKTFISKSIEGTKVPPLEKDANNAYILGDYPSAMQLYVQLLISDSSNPKYNYRTGICVMNSVKDKSLALLYFEKAFSSIEVPFDVFYYSARCYHLSGKYQEAINMYDKYKIVASQTEIAKMQIEQLITQCKNGILLKNDLPKYDIINSKMVFSESVYQSFNTYEFSGKFLIIPDEFRTDLDIKNNFKSIVFLTKDNKSLFYASYGVDGKTGKDIYLRMKLPSGDWSEPKYLQGVNSAMDEDYPFVTDDGFLYFSSTGFNSVGGYDVFRSEWSYTSQSWNEPKNLGSPVNSPANDIFFILCKDGISVYFSSDRNSLPGQVDIFNAQLIK